MHCHYPYDYYNHTYHHTVEDHAKFALHDFASVGRQDSIQETEEGQREDPLEDLLALRKLQLGQLVLANVVMHKPFNEEYQKGS